MDTVIQKPIKANLVRNILHYLFGILPIITGLDKFSNLLVDWDKYAAPLSSIIPFSIHTFMIIVGIIEIIAGIIVLAVPKIGAYIVSLWLVGIVIVLVWGGYYDIAARDLVMAISAFCLAQLYYKGSKNNSSPL